MQKLYCYVDETGQDTQGTLFGVALVVLSKEREDLRKHLRARHIRTEKVRGLRDESDEFIRLADAIAGFVRDAREGKSYAQALYNQAVKSGAIEQL